MTNPQHQISKLMLITEAAYASEQANMTRLTMREAHLRQQILELNSARTSAQTPIADDHAARAGADFLWQRWVDKRVTALNAELARLLVEKAQTRARLTRAFGKFQVTGHMSEQARIARLRDTIRREERET